MLKEHTIIKLKKDMPAANLKAGAVGVVVMAYPAAPQAYEVEFVDNDGMTLALLTLSEAMLRAVEPKTMTKR